MSVNRRFFELVLLILIIAIFFITGCQISKNLNTVNGVKLLNLQENTLRKFSLIENMIRVSKVNFPPKTR
jgi:uncharacterized lipoprotein YajG